MFRTVAKDLFGPRYGSLGRSLVASGILFLAVWAAGWRLPVAPAVWYLTSTLFPAGVMCQALGGGRRAELLQGLLVLPFENRQLVCSYLLGFSAHTLLTKMLPVWALLLAVGRTGSLELAAAFCCGVNGCLSAGAAYLLAKEKWEKHPTDITECRKKYGKQRKEKSPILPAAGMGVAGVLLVWQAVSGLIPIPVLASGPVPVLAASSLGIAGAVGCLSSVDAYHLMPAARSRKNARHTGRKGSMGRYLLRDLAARRAYLVNTAGLWTMAYLLPLLLGESPGLDTLPLGFAVLCLNTPLGTLLSSDPALEQAVRCLPSQVRQFCVPYVLLLAGGSGGSYAVYLVGWQFWNRGVQGIDLWTAGLFAVQSAVLSVWLEWRRPLRDWKTESDLWHHPRKYLVPLGMLLPAVWVASWPPAPWLWTLFLAAAGAVWAVFSRVKGSGTTHPPAGSTGKTR